MESLAKPDNVTEEDCVVPNTGVFHLRSVSAEADGPETIRALRCVEVQCTACSTVSSLSEGSGLVDLGGAGILTCSTCGARQGVSRVRFEEFVKRFPTGVLDGSGSFHAPPDPMTWVEAHC